MFKYHYVHPFNRVGKLPCLPLFLRERDTQDGWYTMSNNYFYVKDNMIRGVVNRTMYMRWNPTAITKDGKRTIHVYIWGEEDSRDPSNLVFSGNMKWIRTAMQYIERIVKKDLGK